MKGIEIATAAAGGWVEMRMAEGALRSLLVNGVIGGVGSVLAFLPQILILFGFLAVLEDCGYMARTAYLMDRMMVRVGLSGKSFIPMLSSFACAIPGIMATRVIENERHRLTTILVAPLLTCSARLPIYTLLIAAFIPAQTYCGGLLQLQGLTLAGLYGLGIVAAATMAMIFNRTLLRGQTPPFVMELPSYKWPSPRTVVYRMIERGWVFLRCAGTLILAVSILVWAALYYPHHPGATPEQQQQSSLLGHMGRIVEPVVKPLGWDWRIGCSVIASIPAREIVVATMGVMYNLGDDPAARSEPNASEASAKLRSVVWDDTGRPVFNIPVALSIMVFFALCAPMRRHAGGDPPRNEQLALAGLHLRLYDDLGLLRGTGDIPIGNVDWTMMTFTWQDAATAGILVGAVGYLARRVVRRIRGRGLPACGGTNGCGAVREQAGPGTVGHHQTADGKITYPGVAIQRSGKKSLMPRAPTGPDVEVRHRDGAWQP